MLCCNGDGVVLVLGQYESRREARDSSAAVWSARRITLEPSVSTNPRTTTLCCGDMVDGRGVESSD